MVIISAGKEFIDIDAFACAIAYHELLSKEGVESRVVFVGNLNHSITKLVKHQVTSKDLTPFDTSYQLTPNDRIVYVDLSDPDHFAFGKGTIDQIVELYDHHYGFEKYWHNKLGDQSHIEHLGAAGTLIWEEFQKRAFADSISAESANLLSLAILQNTLNFTSTETNDRDRNAFTELGKYRTMKKGWETEYFSQCANEMKEHFGATLQNDTKIIERYFDEHPFVFSQLEITEDPKVFLAKHSEEIVSYWSEFDRAHCLINIADMSSKTSLLFSDDNVWLAKTISPLFSSILGRGDTWILIPIHQRKQIYKLIQQQYKIL